MYQWLAMCDGRFCGSEELACVQLTREAAELAFTAEQLVAAGHLLSDNRLSAEERARLERFVATEEMRIERRFAVSQQALLRLDVHDASLGVDAQAAANRARDYLRRTQALLNGRVTRVAVGRQEQDAR